MSQCRIPITTLVRAAATLTTACAAPVTLRAAPPSRVGAHVTEDARSVATARAPGVRFEDESALSSVAGDVQDDASPKSESASDLAKKTQNPVADLITVPFQYNALMNVGHRRRTAHVLNIQPVIPVHLSEDWNLITRTILPIIDSPEIVPGFGDESGLGDLDFTAFLSPAQPEGWIWGVGPTLSVPTATEDELGAERWGLGPSVVALTMDGPWVYGALVKNQWDIGGDRDRRHIKRGLLQPFVNYNMAGGWYVVSAPIVTSDWQADSDDRWTVPIGGGFGRLFLLGEQPINAQIQAFYNVEHPELGPNWTLRLQIQLLF